PPALTLLVVLALPSVGVGLASAARRDDLSEASGALASSPSEKVRVQAALVLGKKRDPRATPFLIRALGDRSPAVRAMSAKSLAEIGDLAARAPLESAKNDPNALVRRCVADALASLTAGIDDTTIQVKAMGDRTNKAPAQLRAQMRDVAAGEVQGFGLHAPGGFTLDGAIKEFATTTRAELIEVKVGVELVLSTGHPRAVMLMATGEAAVQKPKRQYRPAMQPGMEREALEHAVRGASEELRNHFAANGPRR
ncbi:MAG TPA: HEAT repeat domain-containing protein, partial [Polyangia bacterium]|nr:HEAT repeat domain-containing protein [Polyangia bacterium]